MRGWVAVTVLLIVASVVTASTPADHVELPESRCMECHAEGLWNPPMTAARVSQMRFVEDGGAWFLEADVQSTWRDEMRNVTGLVSQPGDALLHPAGGEDRSETLTLSFDAGGQDTAEVATVDVPDDVAGLTFSMQADGLPTATYELLVAPPGLPFSQASEFTAEDVATADGSTWQVRVERSGLGEENDVQVHVTMQSGAVIARAGDVEPNGTASLRFPIDPANGTASATLVVYYDTYYRHAPPTPPHEDLGWLVIEQPFEMQVQGGVPSFPEDPLGEEEEKDTPGVGLVAMVAVLLGALWLRRP